MTALTHRFELRWVAVLLLASSAGLACSDDAKKDGTTSESTSGGEWDEASPRARKVAPSAPAGKPGEGSPAAVAEQKDYSPQLKTAPPIQTNKTPTSTGPSLWGAPDAETGAASPARPPMSKASREAFKRGEEA